MNGLQIFSFQAHDIRIIPVNGEPRFVAKDLADKLGYVWGGIATIDHVPEKWRGVNSVLTPRGPQDMLTLSEAGMWFFLARSDKPLALPMQEWLAEEVLPAIRKTGVYAAPSIALPADLAATYAALPPDLQAAAAASINRMATKYQRLLQGIERNLPKLPIEPAPRKPSEPRMLPGHLGKPDWFFRDADGNFNSAGRYLWWLRQQANDTRAQASENVGCRQALLTAWENNRTVLPTQALDRYVRTYNADRELLTALYATRGLTMKPEKFKRPPRKEAKSIREVLDNTTPDQYLMSRYNKGRNS